MTLVKRWLKQSVPRLVRTACWIALLGLLVMCASIVWPRALPVIFAMSVGHVIGAAAVLCYLLAVILDSKRAAQPDSSHSDAPSSIAPKR